MWAGTEAPNEYLHRGMPQEMLADKLKLLNYEAEFCRKKCVLSI